MVIDIVVLINGYLPFILELFLYLQRSSSLYGCLTSVQPAGKNFCFNFFPYFIQGGF